MPAIFGPGSVSLETCAEKRKLELWHPRWLYLARKGAGVRELIRFSP